MERLVWRKEATRFAAYPMGPDHSDRHACLWPNVALYGAWRWAVSWPGWFVDEGSALDKQGAADAATAAWWGCVTTPIPRDVDLEVDVLIARVLVMPPPNDVWAEDTEFLLRLLQGLRLQFARQLQADALPRPVADLMANLSAELYRRRVAGGEGRRA